MVYYNPYITGEYNPLYNPTNQGFFHCSGDLFFLVKKLGFHSVTLIPFGPSVQPSRSGHESWQRPAYCNLGDVSWTKNQFEV